MDVGLEMERILNPLRFHFLGTNGWYDTAAGNTVCIALEHRDFVLVLDAGNGVQRLDSISVQDRPVFIFLSHLHLDHVSGLHILAKFSFRRRVTIFMPHGQREALETLLSPPYTLSYRDLPYQVVLYELHEALAAFPCKAQVFQMDHAITTLAIRLEMHGKVIAYCPDTGYCESAVRLAYGADLLIAECALRSGENIPDWPHLNPETAAQVAKEAGVKQLVLTHFDSDRYRRLEERHQAQKAAQNIFSNVIAAEDNMQIEI